MLVSFTGAQSSGKTTLLREFLESNAWGSVDEVTRRIRRDGFEINDGGANYNDTQLAIFADHMQNLFTYSGKDMNNILECANNYNTHLPISNLVKEMYKSLVENGHGETDHSSLYKEIERINNK